MPHLHAQTLKQPRIHTRWYLLADLLVCLLTWVLFYYLRTLFYTYPFSMPPGFYLGLALYTGGWIFLHYLSGAYKSVYLKSRFGELVRSFTVSLLGSFFLLFVFILKNPQENNRQYYVEFFSILIPVFVCTTLIRLWIIALAQQQLRKGQVYFNTILIGSDARANHFYQDFHQNAADSGFRITAFFNTNGEAHSNWPGGVKRFQGLDRLTEFIDSSDVEEVIITVDKQDRDLIIRILQKLSDREVNIKITPDMIDIISGALHTHNVMGTPLIDIHSGILPDWQQQIKRVMDVCLSFAGLIMLSPLMLYSMIRVAFSSPGPVLFRQERIGYKGRPFYMYKLRSMYVDAEKDGPRLSHDHDERITNWGKTMRKWRLDELPQLWNIIRGEMSLVGPRPERKFYIDQIVPLHPEYKFLFKVKPGITSWGMVKYGYASSVDEMIRRMPYDLLYVENVSLGLDIKIMFYSIRIILSGKGK